MAKRVMVGDVRRAYGCDWVVLAAGRGRRGEARTMVTVGRRGGDHCETRALATVAAWPIVVHELTA